MGTAAENFVACSKLSSLLAVLGDTQDYFEVYQKIEQRLNHYFHPVFGKINNITLPFSETTFTREIVLSAFLAKSSKSSLQTARSKYFIVSEKLSAACALVCIEVWVDEGETRQKEYSLNDHWVKWEQRENLFLAKPEERVYLTDFSKGT